MKYLLRFFIGSKQICRPEHQFEYSHAAKMVVPRIDEHVWLPTDDGLGVRYMVCDVEYNLYDGETTGFIDVYVVRDDEMECRYEEDY